MDSKFLHLLTHLIHKFASVDEATASAHAAADHAAANPTIPDHLLKRLEFVEGKSDFLKSVGAQLKELRE